MNIDKQGFYVAAISMVKNEADIIEQFVRHNLFYVDFLVVIENNSTDQTPEILRSLQLEGLPLAVLYEPDPAYQQAERMTRLMHHVNITLFPDFIMLLDADEFINCESRAVFNSEMSKIPNPGKGFVRWRNYFPVSENAEPDGSLKNMKQYLTASHPDHDKVIIRLNGRLDREVSVVQGNHDVSVLKDSVKLNKVTLAHFPVRSCRQLTVKGVIGWLAYLAKSAEARQAGQGLQWAAIYDEIVENGEISPAWLDTYVRLYSKKSFDDQQIDAPVEQAPFLRYGNLKYADFRKKELLSVILASVEQNFTPAKNSYYAHLVSLLDEKRISAAATQSGEGSQVFTDRWHYDNTFIDLPPFQYYFRRFKPVSVLDVGCGTGHYLDFFKFHGVDEVMGIDGISNSASLLNDGEYKSIDLNDGFALKRKYDTVICLETLEHIPEKSALTILNLLSAHAEHTILFSAADTGQPGVGHINCKPAEYWIEKWDHLGWIPMENESLTFRLLSTFSWFIRNPLILRPKTNSETDIESRLHEIGHRQFVWWPQKPEIILKPLQYTITPETDTTQEFPQEALASQFAFLPARIRIKLGDIKVVKNIRISHKRRFMRFTSKTDNDLEFQATNTDPVLILPGAVSLQNPGIKIDVASPAENLLQLFYTPDENIGFSEERSISIQLAAGRQTVYLDISEVGISSKLRLDPGIIPGKYIIHEIVLAGTPV